MKNKEVYEFSKVLVKTLVECNSDKKQFEIYRHYRKMLRGMTRNDLLSYVQRDYFVGAIAKVTEFATCYEGFNVSYLRKYDLNRNR